MKKNNLKPKALSTGRVLKITFVLIIAFIIMGTSIFYKANDSIFKLSDNLISQVASAHTNELSQLLDSIIVETSFLANLDSVRSGDWNLMRTELSNYMKAKSDVFEMFFYVDKNGDYQTTSGVFENVREEGYFNQIMNQGKDIVIENVVASRTSYEPTFIIANAVKDKSGKTMGVLGSTILLNQLSNLVQSINIGYGMLIDGTGLITATKDGRFALKFNISQTNEIGLEISSNLLNFIKMNYFGNEIIRDHEGKNQIAYYQPVKGSPNWSLIILVPQDQMMAPAIDLIKIVVLVMIIILLITIIILIKIF
jgi:methyl-accepting chemotaxis protein